MKTQCGGSLTSILLICQKLEDSHIRLPHTFFITWFIHFMASRPV